MPGWIGQFLSFPRRKDVLDKLRSSGAAECHVSVIVALEGAPWLVQSSLGRNLRHLPVAEPNLPLPVTGVWIVSLLGTQGIRWDGAEWLPPDGTVDFVDITAMVDKFQSVPDALSKTRADLVDAVPDSVVDFSDISAVVDGFKGLGYPFDVPDGCP